MERETKTMLTTAGVSFIAGVAVTLTILALSCCPQASHHRRPQAMPPKIEAAQPARIHHSEHVWHAQRPAKAKGRHPSPEMKKNFVEKLGLTEEQQAKAEQFRQESMAQAAPIFKEIEALEAKADKLREENKARFEEILTAEQKEILKTMHPRRGAEMRKHPERPKAAPAEQEAPQS